MNFIQKQQERKDIEKRFALVADRLEDLKDRQDAIESVTMNSSFLNKIKYMFNPLLFKFDVDKRQSYIISARNRKSEGFAKSADLTLSGKNGDG